MSSKDSAADKLVASIRKTKTAKTTGAGSVKSTTGNKSTKKTAVKKSLQRSGKKAAPTAAVKTAETSKRKARLIDLFQSGRRVWPD